MNEGYSICLNEWALDKDIKNELGLLLIISSLTAEKGFCFASNKYLADLFDTDEAQISKKIAKLISKGYLQASYVKRGSEIISRELRLSKMTTDHCQKTQPTDVKNDKDNNTSINNTSINKRENNKKRNFVPPTIEEVEQYVSENNLSVNAKDFIDYFEATGWVDAKGQKVVSWKGKIRTWEKFQPRAKPKIRGATFADLLKEEYGDDQEGDTTSYEPFAKNVSKVLCEYDIE